VKQVKHVYENVPYYKNLMDEKGVTPDDIKGIEDLHKLPFLTKADLRDAYPYGLLAKPLNECVRIHSTSGTTGRRVVAFYTQNDVDTVATLRLMGTDEDRPKIDSVIDAVVVRFKEELNEDEQIKCKSAVKNFNRCYPYFSAIMPYESSEWEKQYVFYSLLVKKLPKLKIDDYTDGLLDNIDFDKYRIIKEEERSIALENENSNVNPIPVGTGGGKPQPEMDALSSIVKDFNDIYGNIEWKNRDEVQRQIEELPARIATSVDFVNAVRNGDKQVAQITFNDDIINIVAGMLEEKTEFVQTYFANQDFQNYVNARVFEAAVSKLSNQSV
jgi:type I restriction enzyme R subunit